MIKYVLQIIPTNVMSIFLLLKTLIDEIENGGSAQRGIK